MNGLIVGDLDEVAVEASGKSGKVAYYRQKAFLIEAIQFTAATRNTCFNFVSNCRPVADLDAEKRPILRFKSPQGMTAAYLRDWIIKVADGQFYVLSDRDFRLNYDWV